MATSDEYAMLSGPVPAGFAVYQLPGIQLGDHTYYGWKMVKQKSESYTDEDGEEQTRQVDDESAAVVYDGTTQLIQSNAELVKTNADLKNQIEMANNAILEISDLVLTSAGSSSTTAGGGA